MDKGKMMDDTEIQMRGIEALHKSLGVAATLRFLTLLHRQPINYVEISQRLYEGQTVEDIMARAQQTWKG
ncbi:MAG: hypothetical protein Fur0025_42040 [Oscillatoriaceae cyanobacterium]